MITSFKSVSRCAVEERDGRLYVAGVQIDVSADIEGWRAMDDARRSFGHQARRWTTARTTGSPTR